MVPRTESPMPTEIVNLPRLWYHVIVAVCFPTGTADALANTIILGDNDHAQLHGGLHERSGSACATA